jgi:hypothetical protein
MCEVCKRASKVLYMTHLFFKPLGIVNASTPWTEAGFAKICAVTRGKINSKVALRQNAIVWLENNGVLLLATALLAFFFIFLK